MTIFFFLFRRYITKHLMSAHEGNSLFCFPERLNVSQYNNIIMLTQYFPREQIYNNNNVDSIFPS